jgi:predicted aldo/keto reductase-like oxidoreductase
MLPKLSMTKKPNNKLESNGVYLSSLGLGIEHFARGVRSLENLSRDENSKLIIEEAYKLGITHYDLVFNLPYFFQVFKNFIKDKRKKITFTTHLGSFYNEKASGHSKTRSLNKIQSTYDGMLESLDVDYADIALLQFITNKEDYENVLKKGILDYALQLKREGKAKAVGISAHKPNLLIKMIENGDFDAIMFPLNFATGSLDSTKKLMEICKRENIAVIGIKNLLKGKVFSTKRTNYPAYFCGGNRFSIKLDEPATPADCLNYGFDMGADTVVFGVKTVDELKNNMRSYNKESIPRNYLKTVKYFEEAIQSSQ